MTYTWLALGGAMLAIALDLLGLRTALVRRRAFWASYAIIVAFQLLVNGLLAGLPVVRYDERRIIGWRVAYAPVEDLLFGFALVLVTLSVWVRLGRFATGRGSANAPTGPGQAPPPVPGRGR